MDGYLVSASEAQLLGRWRQALDDWQAQPSGATSSITGGGAVAALEAVVSAACAGRAAVAVSSGTTALAACLLAVGVRPGSQVICSALDWSAAADAIRLVGARPRQVDVDPATLTLSPAAVAAARDRATAAIVATHLFGIPADVAALREAGCGVPVVEDCAQAWGARLDGQPVGSLADAAAFSFGAGKIVDGGEGGAAVLATQRAWSAAVAATQHPVRRRAAGDTRVRLHVPGRIHPVAAVLALSSARSAARRVAAARRAVTALRTRLPDLAIPGTDTRRDPCWWRVPVPAAAAGIAPGLGVAPIPARVAGTVPQARRASAELTALAAGDLTAVKGAPR